LLGTRKQPKVGANGWLGREPRHTHTNQTD